MRGISSNQIFRNFNNYLSKTENLHVPKNFLETLMNDATYKDFINALTEGMSESQRIVADIVCDSQREFLMQESANILNTDIAIGYAISYFPILCDTYCTNIIGDAILYKKVNQPIFTVPKMKMIASVKNSDGTTDSWTFPRALFLMRSGIEYLEVKPKVTNDLFKLSKSYPTSVNPELSKVNKRYTTLQTLYITATDNDTNETQDIEYTVAIRPDSRSQINSEFEIGYKETIIKCTLIGHINFDSGLLQFNLTNNLPANSNLSIVLNKAKLSTLFTSKTGDVGRVKISVTMSGMDMAIDVNEDFEFDLDVETLQEYNDIYNIDLIRTMSTAIKGQLLLNRDHDIAHLLETAEPEMKLNHTYDAIKFAPLFDGGNVLSPGYYQAIYQNIIPKLTLITRYMYYNTTLIPTYLLCGIKTSAMLESLQEFSISFPEMRSGVGGFNNSYGHDTVDKHSFRYYNILMSHAIPDDKIYLMYKPTTPEEEHYANIVNFIYKPLYMVEEITNSQKRTFIRTRSMTDLINPHSLGCLHLDDIDTVLTTYDYEPRKIILT